jgi:hypothetical protein
MTANSGRAPTNDERSSWKRRSRVKMPTVITGTAAARRAAGRAGRLPRAPG